MAPVRITHYSDVLCIWAYVAQARLDEIKRVFLGDARIDYRFCSVFADTRSKIGEGWKDRGGWEAYGRHVLSVAARFPHVKVREDIWTGAQPLSSASPHLFLSAVLLWERARGHVAADAEPPVFEAVAWALRRGFFAEGLDIGRWEVQAALARPHGVDIGAVEAAIRSGEAFARLQSDYQDADKARIEGSPTFVLNAGRQKLYGNVGFRVIEANIREMLREPDGDRASWC